MGSFLDNFTSLLSLLDSCIWPTTTFATTLFILSGRRPPIILRPPSVLLGAALTTMEQAAPLAHVNCHHPIVLLEVVAMALVHASLVLLEQIAVCVL